MIPIATLDPITFYSVEKQQGYLDLPFTCFTDYFFDTVDYPSTLTGEEDWFGRTKLKQMLQSPKTIHSIETAGLLRKSLEQELSNETLRGPGFKNLSDRFDVRPWREIEKNYDKFLIVPQTVRDVQLLAFLKHITVKGFFEAGCEELLKCLQNGRATLVFIMPREGGYWSHESFLAFKSFFQSTQINPESVVLLFGQSKQAEEKMKEWYNIRVKSFNFFESFPFEIDCQDLNKNTMDIFRKTCISRLEKQVVENNALFFSHIGNAYFDRTVLYSVLSRLFAKISKVNMSNVYKNDLTECYSEALSRICTNYEKYTRCVGKELVILVREIIEKDKQHLPKCRVVSPTGTLYGCHNILKDSYRTDSLIEVFAETINLDFRTDPEHGTNMLHFFTEKTFKPLASMKPFFVFGNKGTLKCLKEMGYKTFDRWWDESYDLEEDTMLRILMIIRELQKISLYSKEEIYLMVSEMRPTLEYNFDLRIKRALEGQINFENCLKDIYDNNHG